jgi:hypothetical protein
LSTRPLNGSAGAGGRNLKIHSRKPWNYKDIARWAVSRAFVGPTEQPGFSAKGHTTQPALGGVVRKADAAIFEEQPEGGGSFENVVDRLGEIMAAGQPIQSRAQVNLKLLDHRPAFVPANRQTLVRAFPVDRSLDLEQGVDTTHDLDRNR